jgi:hypothetical protein
VINTPARVLFLLLLLLGSIPAAGQDRQSSGEIRIAHISTSRFVGTVRRAFPFEPFSGAAPVPLSFEIRLVVLVHVDRWLDEPNVTPLDGMLAIFLDDPHRWFGHLPAAWSGKTFAPAGKTWLFTLTSSAGTRGAAYKLEVGPTKPGEGRR